MFKQIDNNDQTVLQFVATDPALLKEALNSLPQDSRLEFLKSQVNNGDMLLHTASERIESLETVLNSLPAAHVLEALNLPKKNGQSILQKAATHVEFPQQLGDILSDSKKKEMMNAVDLFKRTLLHQWASNPLTLKLLLTIHPAEQRRTAVNITDDYYNNTVTHFAADNLESLKIILEFVPENEWLAHITKANGDGDVVLRECLSNPEFIKLVLTQIPEDQRLSFLHTTINGESILDQCINHKPKITGFEPELGDSFIPTYINIRACLAKEVKSPGFTESGRQYINSFFYKPDSDNELVNQLNKCKTLEEVKTHLNNYVEKNANSKIADAINDLFNEEKNINQELRNN